MTDEIRTTVFIPADLVTKFSSLTREVGVSGTALLSKGLPHELDYLAEVPVPSERDAARFEAASKFVADYPGDSPETPGETSKRLNITLERQTAERMNQLCREKRIRRDDFIRNYMLFLVHGEEGVCTAPLEKIAALLANPRHEYEETRRSGPQEDEVLLNEADNSYQVRPAVSQENPYRRLAYPMDEGLLELLEGAMQKGKVSK